MKNQNSEKIKKALELAIQESSSNGLDAVERILQTLDQQKIVRYHNDGDVNLLSTSGKVLVSLIEDSTMTIRAIATYLGLSETMIDKTVKSLMNAGLVTKTKVNRQNVYKLNKKIINEQLDIRQFLRAISLLNDENVDDEIGNSDPF
jgi:Mn-dependent DtxR family transcriptional regulator